MLDSPCGKGAATGATARVVTNTSITIDCGDDAGDAAAPGLDQEMSDAVKPMIAWCNAQGGINGRETIGNYSDVVVAGLRARLGDQLVGNDGARAADGTQKMCLCQGPCVEYT